MFVPSANKSECKYIYIHNNALKLLQAIFQIPYEKYALRFIISSPLMKVFTLRFIKDLCKILLDLSKFIIKEWNENTKALFPNIVLSLYKCKLILNFKNVKVSIKNDFG